METQASLLYTEKPCPEPCWIIFTASRHTKAGQKVSDLWPGKIHLHTWRSATLILFEVVSLWQNTLLPEILPLFEAFLEWLFANDVQFGRRVPYNVVSWVKSSPFQLHFQVGEQPKITRSHVGRVGSLSNHRNVVFGQERLNQLRRMSRCVVMMQLPLPDHWSEWNVPNQCLSPRPPQVLGRWHDGPAWPKPALGRWARHFGLLRAYRNERCSPQTCGHLWICCTTP